MGPSVDNPDPSTAIPGIYVGAATPAVGEDGRRLRRLQGRRPRHGGPAGRLNRFPPVGGPHDGEWANCNGVVYTTAVRDENMVHTLEHGAVWITYDPDTIPPDDLTTLTAVVKASPT